MEGINGTELVGNAKVLQNVKGDRNVIQVMLYSGQLCTDVHWLQSVSIWGFHCSWLASLTNEEDIEAEYCIAVFHIKFDSYITASAVHSCSLLWEYLLGFPCNGRFFDKGGGRCWRERACKIHSFVEFRVVESPSVWIQSCVSRVVYRQSAVWFQSCKAVSCGFQSCRPHSVSCKNWDNKDSLNKQAALYSPVYSLRRARAYGEFKSIVTEVGHVRKTVRAF
jgi:hypothetical protein